MRQAGIRHSRASLGNRAPHRKPGFGRARRRQDPPASYDELHVAELTGIPVQVLVGFGVAVICISGAWLARYLPRGRRALAVVSMLAGAVFSAGLYFGYVGPWLLP